MPLNTPVTALLVCRHPILLAPMDLVAGARLTAAVSIAGGFGILGGGYGDKGWLKQEIDALIPSVGDAPFGIGFITWSLARQPELLDLALESRPRAIMLSFGDPRPFAPRIKSAGALLICQVQNEDMASEALEAGADLLVAQGTEAGGHGASRSTLDIVPAIVDLAAGRVPVVAAGGIADGRGLVAKSCLGCGRRSPRHAILCQSGSRRRRRGQAAHRRRLRRRYGPGADLRHLAPRRVAGAVHRPLPDQRSRPSLAGP